MKPALLPALLAASALSVSANALAQSGDTTGDTSPSRDKFTQIIADKAATAENAVDPSAVQAKRDEGWGWGAIANFFGFNLGSAVSQANRERRDERLADLKDRPVANHAVSGHGGGRENGMAQGGRHGDSGGGRGQGGGGGQGGGNGGGGGRR